MHLITYSLVDIAHKRTQQTPLTNQGIEQSTKIKLEHQVNTTRAIVQLMEKNREEVEELRKRIILHNIT